MFGHVGPLSTQGAWVRRARRARRAHGHVGHVGHVGMLGTPFSRLHLKIKNLKSLELFNYLILSSY